MCTHHFIIPHHFFSLPYKTCCKKTGLQGLLLGPAFSATDTSQNIAMFIKLNYDAKITKGLIRPRLFTYWSAPLLFECNKIMFFNDKAHM